MVDLKAGAEVEAVDAAHALAAHLVKHALHAEGLGNGAQKRGQQHAGQAHQINDELELIRLVHANAGMVDARKTPQQVCPEAGLYLIARAHGLDAHAHDLCAKAQHIALLIQGADIFFHKGGLAFADLHEMRLYRVALVLAAILALDQAAVKVDHAVFLAPLILQIAGWNDAHVDLLRF